MSDQTRRYIFFPREIYSIIRTYCPFVFLSVSLCLSLYLPLSLSLSRVIEVISHLEDDEWTGRSVPALPLLSV